MKALTFLKIITIGNLVIATGFSIVGIINPRLLLPDNTTADEAIIVFAFYAGARTLPLAAVAIISVYNRCTTLLTLAFLAGVIQLLDGFIGVYQKDLSKSLGPFIIAAIEFVAIYLTGVRGKK